jgi:TRAP-type C4-dicarboxylate transport system substrate-binding protein
MQTVKLRVVLALTAALSSAPALSQTIIKMATVAPEGSKYHQILKEMADKWKTVSGGKVEVRLYPGSVAGDDIDVIRKMRLGTLNAALLTSVGVARVDKSVFALQIPMLYRSYDEVEHALEKLGPKLEASLEAKGFVVLNWADAGWVHFFTKTPVLKPDDLKPLKLFSWAGDSEATEIWKGAGFNPVPLPSTEISTALQTGLVQALPTTPQAAVLLQWYTHAKNMTDVKWALLLGATIISKSTWEKIPPDIRPALLAAAREAGAKIRAEVRAAGERDIDAMKKRGLNVIPVDEKTEALWRAAAESTYDKIRGKIIPAESFDEARKVLTEYRKQKASTGSR